MSSFDLIHLYPCATIKKKIFADKKKNPTNEDSLGSLISTANFFSLAKISNQRVSNQKVPHQ